MDAGRHAWRTGCRCSTCTGWCSACSGHCGSGSRLVHTGRPTPQALRRGRRRRCTSVCRRCGRGSAPSRDGGRAARRPPGRVGQRPASRRRVRADAGVDRSGAGRAVRDDRDADHGLDASRRRASPGLGRAADHRRREPAGRRRRHADDATTARRSANCRSAARRCSTATSTAPTPPRSRSTATGSAPATRPSIDDGGFHRIVGRQSIDIIKTGGFKVGAGEVEAALLTHPGCRRVRGGRRQPTPTSVSGSSPTWSATASTAAALIDHVAALLSVAQAPARGPHRRRAAAQRDGQGPEDTAHLSRADGSDRGG